MFKTQCSRNRTVFTTANFPLRTSDIQHPTPLHGHPSPIHISIFPLRIKSLFVFFKNIADYSIRKIKYLTVLGVGLF